MKKTCKSIIKYIDWDKAIVYMALITGFYTIGVLSAFYAVLGLALDMGIIIEFVSHPMWLLIACFLMVCVLKQVKTRLLRREVVEDEAKKIILTKQPVEDNTSASDTDFIVMSRKTFLLDKMHDAQSFELSKEEVSSYFEQISLYIEANNYSAYRHMQKGDLIAPLSERQEVCSQNAINCLFKKEFVQALHETMDVLSDYNKDTRLNYNEYVVLQNILTVYEHLKEKQDK